MQGMVGFDLVAETYIRDDEHWGSDLDVLKAAFNRHLEERSYVRYLDLGCGTGFHITMMKRLYPRSLIVGADSSCNMLTIAQEEIGRLKLTEVELVHADVTQLTTEAQDVISFLNNGLGNMRLDTMHASHLRMQVIGKVRSLLRKDGSFVISVYNLDALTEPYGRIVRILPKSDPQNGDLFIEYRSDKGTEEFYSHWFRKMELIELLEQNGFKVGFLEKRMSRLIACATAV
jgi:SAM-dependent methyltransferase